MPVAVRSISMSVSASISSSQQARQDGLDVPGEGADEHQSVEPHVARNTNKASVCRIHVQLQVVVFSNSSIRFMSSVVVISMASRRRPSRPCSPPPSPSPTCTQARSTQSAVRGHEKSADPRSGRIERPAARSRGRGGGVGGALRARGTAAQAARESSRSGFEALKSTGLRRRVPRPASPARAASRQCASGQLQPAVAPDLSRYRTAAPASLIICRGSSQFVSCDYIRNHQSLNQLLR